MENRLIQIKKQHELGTLDRKDIDWLIEQAEKTECMAWALNILKWRTSAVPDFDQFHFIAKQGLGEENSPFKTVKTGIEEEAIHGYNKSETKGESCMNEMEILELEKLLLKFWAENGMDEIYKYKHRVKWFREREGLTHIELFTDLTNGLLFADVKDIANYSDMYPEDCKVSVASLMKARNITL